MKVYVQLMRALPVVRLCYSVSTHLPTLNNHGEDFCQFPRLQNFHLSQKAALYSFLHAEEIRSLDLCFDVRPQLSQASLRIESESHLQTLRIPRMVVK